MNQQFADNMHTLGRFRLSITRSAVPLTDGLPENLLAIGQVAADQRNEEQQKTVLDFFKTQDDEFKKKSAALAEAQKPRPEDPKLVQLRNSLAEAQKPLPMDPQLARLKRAVELGTQQLGTKRLTVAQDYAWALINSPAFLFNR
jgi:hypothetical protein